MLTFSTFTNAVFTEKNGVAEPTEKGMTVPDVIQETEELRIHYYDCADDKKEFLKSMKEKEALEKHIKENGLDATINKIVSARIIVEVEMKELDYIIGSTILARYYKLHPEYKKNTEKDEQIIHKSKEIVRDVKLSLVH